MSPWSLTLVHRLSSLTLSCVLQQFNKCNGTHNNNNTVINNMLTYPTPCLACWTPVEDGGPCPKAKDRLPWMTKYPVIRILYKFWSCITLVHVKIIWVAGGLNKNEKWQDYCIHFILFWCLRICLLKSRKLA